MMKTSRDYDSSSSSKKSKISQSDTTMKTSIDYNSSSSSKKSKISQSDTMMKTSTDYHSCGASKKPKISQAEQAHNNWSLRPPYIITAPAVVRNQRFLKQSRHTIIRSDTIMKTSRDYHSCGASKKSKISQAEQAHIN
ncbi:hypothetical protein J6590_077624 [Homalodisca vitripennis]|nr:hypothetical protein J6590_077624 [Homalodisca vitripennis]